MKKLLLILLIFAGMVADASAQLIRKEQIEDVFARRGEAQTITGNWRFTGKIELDASVPAQITTDQHNYALPDKNVLRVTTDAARSFTGFASGGNWRPFHFINAGSFDITLAHESGSSTAANRIASVTGADLGVGAGKVAICLYDTTSTRWRCGLIGATGGSGTPGGSSGQVQLNVASAFAGDAGLTYNTTTDVLTALGGFVGGDCGTNCLTWNTASITGSKVYTAPNATGTILLDSSTATETNKTINAESTGNNITIPDYWDYDLAGCVDGNPSQIWNSAVSGTPTPRCATGSNRIIGYAEFPDSDGDVAVHISKDLPPGWGGALDARIKWWSAQTTGNVVFQVATACIATGEADDAAFNTASTVTSTAQGTASRYNVATLTGITTTGCAAGETMRIKFFRNRTHASDTIAGVVNVEKIIFTARITH